MQVVGGASRWGGGGTLDDTYWLSLLSPRELEAAAAQDDVVVWTKVCA